MRLLGEADVAHLLDPALALAAADAAYRLHSAGRAGRAGTLGRIDLRQPATRRGALTLSVLAEDGALVVKTNVHAHAGPGGARAGASLLTLWDAATCRPRALVATAAFNTHRTAAGFGAACRRLAAPEAETLAVFGAGLLAPQTIRYLAAVRPIRRVTIVGRDPARAAALAAQATGWPGFGHIRVAAARDARAAAAEADIIAAVTSADAAVFPGEAVRPGTFVVLGGANRPNAREADDALIARAQIVVDDLEGCLARAGDLAIPLATGVLRRAQILGELGALPAAGSAARGDVTVFKSIGLATQDLVLAVRLLARAEAAGLGTVFDPATGAVEMRA